MSPRTLIVLTGTAVVALLLGFIIPVPAHAACKQIGPLCQPGTGCEPRCITTSDGGPGRDNMYTDGRARQRMYQRYRARAAAQRRDPPPWKGSNYASRAQRQQEGRDRWRDDGQVVQGLPGKISPFVPGSTQDLAWKEERRRRGVQ